MNNIIKNTYLLCYNLTMNLELSLQKAKDVVFKILPEIKGLEVIIKEDTEAVIPELGISGKYEKDKNLISIFIDSKHENIRGNFNIEILKTFAHEYVHAYREQVIPWENGTLLDCLISEGLSQSIELELTSETPIYAQALSEQAIISLLSIHSDILKSTSFDYKSWFFGSEKIEKWTGYSVGFWLVQKYLKKYKKKASDVLQMESSNFI